MHTNKSFQVLFFVVIVFVVAVITHHAEAAVLDWQKGVTISPRYSTDFASTAFRQSVLNAKANNANYVTLVIPYTQTDLYSTNISPAAESPSDATLINAIQYIHGQGLKVMLKPHLDPVGGAWRANINPSDRTTWFTNYGNMILHYAQLSAQYNVEQLCIGAELIYMSSDSLNSTNTQNWNNLIASIRSVYNGKLTYSANWGGSGFADEKNQIKFWPSLDYIGISAYFNINTDNQVSNMMGAWNNYNISDIGPLAQKYGKPILFTEIGYKSVTDSHREPWNYNYSGSANQTEQANDYEALFSYWDGQSFMQGVHLWDWSSDPAAGGANDTNYTPQNKLAQDTMKKWFGGTATPTPVPPSATCAAPATNAFTGCYYNDSTLGNLVLSRTDTSINFDWGAGSPDPSLPNDNFSARWQGNFNFNAGDYTFTATGDDGLRVIVDGVVLIDQWKDQPATTYTAVKNLSAGTHAITMEYYEKGGNAVAKLSWAQNTSSASNPPPPVTATASCPAAASGNFTACFYNDQTLNNFIFSRNDSVINFDWGNGSPDPRIPNDHFSAKWDGNFNFAAGDYAFSATADDGVRVFIDNVTVIDQWKDQGPTTYTFTKTLTAGTHAVRMEYYENTGGAVAKLSWAQSSTTASPPPPPTGNPPPPPASQTINIWWPTQNSTVCCLTPFKGVLNNTDVNQYTMYWQVDGGGLVNMPTNNTDYPHKEFLTDLSTWTWRGNGPYHLNFVAKDLSGNILAQQPVDIMVSH